MSVIGSRPGSPSVTPAAQSSTWTSTVQRSTCLRKSRPSPLPRLAPGISPGTSATTNWVFPASTTPRCGISVVNGQVAIFGLAADMAEMSDDLPALGNPMRPASATVLSSSTKASSVPGSPLSAKPGALRRGEPRAGSHEVGEHLSGLGLHHGAVRHTQNYVRSLGAAPVGPAALRAVVGLAHRAAVKVQQGDRARVHLEDHIPAAAPVAAVRAAERLELLPVD